MNKQPVSVPPQPRARARARWVLAAFMAITLFLLVSEHRAHGLGWGLHVLVGVCVLLLYLNTRAHEHDGGDDDIGRP